MDHAKLKDAVALHLDRAGDCFDNIRNQHAVGDEAIVSLAEALSHMADLLGCLDQRIQFLEQQLEER